MRCSALFVDLGAHSHGSDLHEYVKQPAYDQQLYILSLTSWAPLMQNLIDFVNSTLRNVWTSKVSLREFAHSGTTSAIQTPKLLQGDHEPDWSGTGYSFSGRSVSQRDIDRLVRLETARRGNCLLSHCLLLYRASVPNCCR